MASEEREEKERDSTMRRSGDKVPSRPGVTREEKKTTRERKKTRASEPGARGEKKGQSTKGKRERRNKERGWRLQMPQAIQMLAREGGLTVSSQIPTASVVTASTAVYATRAGITAVGT